MKEMEVMDSVQSNRSKILVQRETRSAYLFLLPSLIFFLGFVIFPMILCVYTSFFDATMGKNVADQFIGLKNYMELFGDKVFQKALLNTLIIVLVSVPFVAVFSLWVSSLIYKMSGPVLSAFRCIFYLPVVTGSVAVTVVWKWMFHNYYGLFDYVGTHTGLLEAAKVDGATDLQLFWKIKWPQIMPTTLYILVITTINSFQCFALIQLLTSGGPNHSTDTVMYYIYYTAFKLYRYGYGNAMGVILAVIIALLSALQFQLAKEK